MSFHNPLHTPTLTEKVKDKVLTVETKVEDALHIPRHETPHERHIHFLHRIFYWVSLFVAGFVAAKIHTLVFVGR